MSRVILHCDCNSFFASVETVLDPSYRGVPMAVCGSEEDRHGIVLAKNEEAKKYGIKTAETVWSARRKCPHLVIAKPHYSEYVKYSALVNAIYARYTDIIEPFGIDESWLDVTASLKLFGSGKEIAERIREEVKRETGLTVSIGVSFNKVFAKLGSDYKKPDAITVISEESFRDIVFPLPASSLLFVGEKTAATLGSMGIRTVGDLAATNPALLNLKLGKAGEMLYKYANGLDDSPVSRPEEKEDAKSVGNGFTFRHDLATREECRIGIEFLSEEIARRLRAMGKKCTTVVLTVKDVYLQAIQRQRQQSPPTDIGKDIAASAFRILSESWSETKPVRMITVTATGLVDAASLAEQLDFFATKEDEQRREKDKKREETIDIIRQKFGNTSITSGAILSSDIGIYEPKTRIPEKASNKKH